MRSSRPSVTARHVAVIRAGLSRPVLDSGDAEAETRLYRSLGPSRLPRTVSETRRMERRTRFFDAETIGAIRRGVSQVVIVAAGYDGRALRFASPGVRWFEVDHPSTQADKRRRLAGAGIDARSVVFVPVDLTSDDLGAALQRAGHDQHRASLFVVEGLLGYLTREVTQKLLRELRDRAGDGSRLAVAFPTRPRDPGRLDRMRLKVRSTVVALVGEPWLVRFERDEPDALLERAGWRVARSLRGSGPARYEGAQGVLIGAEPASAVTTAAT